jgi:hypothetical protein
VGSGIWVLSWGGLKNRFFFGGGVAVQERCLPRVLSEHFITCASGMHALELAHALLSS